MDATMAIKDWYHYIMESKADKRTSSWLLMSSPWPMLIIVISYLVFIKVAPLYMASRDAYKLKHLLIGYNFGLVLMSLYMFYEFAVTTIFNSKFQTSCQPVDYSNNSDALRLASAVWWYFFSKIIELLDTVFFIIRKKNNQVTFLHVYHHSTMIILWWLGTKFVAGGESYFSAMINSFIHILMYIYYMLSACGPSMAKYLWWKRHMTTLQLVQFVIVICHTAYAFHLNCGFPRAYLGLLIFYMTSHIILFSNFYYKAYVTKKQLVNHSVYHSNGNTKLIDNNHLECISTNHEKTQ